MSFLDELDELVDQVKDDADELRDRAVKLLETHAREHPDRQDVRIVAGATRAGATYCALRLRAADEDRSVLTGAELVPGLLALLRETLEDDAGEAAGDLAAPGEDD